jgi:hypothetical protein
MPDVLSAIVWQLRSLTLRARSLVLKPRSGESRRNERVLVSVGKNFPGRHCQVVASLPTSRFLSCKARTGRSTLASITNGIWRLACSKWRWLQSLDLRSAPLPPALLRSYGRSMAGIRPGVALQVDRMAESDDNPACEPGIEHSSTLAQVVDSDIPAGKASGIHSKRCFL